MPAGVVFAECPFRARQLHHMWCDLGAFPAHARGGCLPGPPTGRPPPPTVVQVYYSERCGAWLVVQLDSTAESAPDFRTILGPFRRSFCLDRQGTIQAIAGIVIALIALLTSYGHIAFPAGAALQLPHQWGVWFIVASMALVVVDPQLATGSRLRAAQDAARAANEAAEERNRAAEERERAARSDRVQARALRAGALAWLDPSPLHRRFLELISTELADLAGGSPG